jgi:hypothetical protein
MDRPPVSRARRRVPRIQKSQKVIVNKSLAVGRARFLTKRTNHSEACSDGQACTNQAESFFSRLRRAEIGIHHHVAGPYLSAYASEMAWRENNRRVSNGEQYLMTASAALTHPVSRQWIPASR